MQEIVVTTVVAELTMPLVLLVLILGFGDVGKKNHARSQM